MNKVLIIDDNVEFCRLMEALLRSEGYEPISANSGVAGIARAEEQQPHLILLDQRMPEMDGWAVLKELRRRKATQYIPIIVLTGYADDPEAERTTALDLSADEFLTKPIDPPVLVRQIRSLLSVAPRFPVHRK